MSFFLHPFFSCILSPGFATFITFSRRPPPFFLCFAIDVRVMARRALTSLKEDDHSFGYVLPTLVFFFCFGGKSTPRYVCTLSFDLIEFTTSNTCAPFEFLHLPPFVPGEHRDAHGPPFRHWSQQVKSTLFPPFCLSYRLSASFCGRARL